MQLECSRTREPACLEDLPGPLGNCRLAFIGQKNLWSFVCESANCSAGNYQMRTVRDGLRWKSFSLVSESFSVKLEFSPAFSQKYKNFTVRRKDLQYHI